MVENVENVGNISTKVTTSSPVAVIAKKSKSSLGGRVTCCVPNSFNNSRENKEFLLYFIPINMELGKKWPCEISAISFVLSSSHCASVVHFEGKAKTYMSSISTVVPKILKPEIRKPRSTWNSQGIREEVVFSPIPVNEEMSIETQCPQAT